MVYYYFYYFKSCPTIYGTSELGINNSTQDRDMVEKRFRSTQKIKVMHINLEMEDQSIWEPFLESYKILSCQHPWVKTMIGFPFFFPSYLCSLVVSFCLHPFSSYFPVVIQLGCMGCRLPIVIPLTCQEKKTLHQNLKNNNKKKLSVPRNNDFCKDKGNEHQTVSSKKIGVKRSSHHSSLLGSFSKILESDMLLIRLELGFFGFSDPSVKIHFLSRIMPF